MPRIKPKNRITTRDQAEASMARLNEIDHHLAAWDMDEARRIAALREMKAREQRSEGRLTIETEKALLLKELKLWADKDSNGWKTRGLELKLGRLGFRTGMPTVVLVKKVAKNLANALALLLLHMPEFVRTKEEIDKEGILAEARDKDLDKDLLAQCGLKVTQKEEFWVETDASVRLDKAVKALKVA